VVCHNKLLSKLSAYGIVGDLIDWIRVFLSNRSQCTVSMSFSKRFACCSNLAYCERLTNLGLDRLELRR